MKKYILSILFIFIVSATALADTHPASSCSYGDVNTAVSAATTGDTVTIPSGPCDWGGSTLSISSAITIIGAGSGTSATCDSDVSTCITGTARMFTLATASSGEFAFKLSGVHFTTSYSRVFDITGGASGWRLYNNYFRYTGSGKAVIGIATNGSSHTLYGLIDSNYFKNCYLYLGGGNTAANSSWTAAAQWGTANALFIENNTFDYSDGTIIGVALDSQNGGRATVRYNTFINFYIMAHAFQGTTVRGARSYEIYNNTFVNNFSASVSSPYFVHLRAGSGVITKNKVMGRWSWSSGQSTGSVNIDNRRSWFDPGVVAVGYCDGTSIYDQNTDPNPASGVKDGYRCADQPGAGTQTGTWGSNPSFALDPIYVWDNISAKMCLTGSDAFKECASNGDCVNADCYIAPTTPNNVTTVISSHNANNAPYHMVSGRDFYDAVSGSNEKAEYTPYTCPHPTADPSAQGACDNTKYGTTGYTLTGGASDTTAPTVTSAYINALTTVFNFSENITATSGAAFTISGLASAMTLTCPAVSTAASSITCTNSRTVYQSEGNGTYGYTGAKVVDTATSPNALAEISSSPVATNMSTEVETPPAVRLTVTKTGSGCTITSVPSGVNCGSACTLDVETGTVTTLSGWSENGWNAITYGGDCAANGTVTMSGAKTCTATCTQVQLLN